MYLLYPVPVVFSYMCVFVFALGTLLLQTLQSIAYSAATWTVEASPNFSIHRHKRKLTLSLCLFPDTTHRHTHTWKLRLQVIVVDGHFWRFSYAMPLQPSVCAAS